jgi:hypothetical protein
VSAGGEGSHPTPLYQGTCLVHEVCGHCTGTKFVGKLVRVARPKFLGCGKLAGGDSLTNVGYEFLFHLL